MTSTTKRENSSALNHRLEKRRRRRRSLYPARRYEKSLGEFGTRIRGLAGGLWSGVIEWTMFGDSMALAIYRGYEQAWQEGAERCGITPEERSDRERIILQREINADVGRVKAFGDWIAQRTKALGKPRAPVLARAELWTHRYVSIQTLAQVTACADGKFIWRLGPTTVHCADCLSYRGKVYRASIWHKWNAIPQSHSLECGGWHCACSLVQTNAPLTPGHPRQPTGG